MRDDLDQSSKRETTTHIPRDQGDSLDSAAGTDKRNGKSLIYEETFDYYLNVPKHVRSCRRNVYLAV